MTTATTITKAMRWRAMEFIEGLEEPDKIYTRFRPRIETKTDGYQPIYLKRQWNDGGSVWFGLWTDGTIRMEDLDEPAIPPHAIAEFIVGSEIADTGDRYWLAATYTTRRGQVMLRGRTWRELCYELRMLLTKLKGKERIKATQWTKAHAREMDDKAA